MSCGYKALSTGPEHTVSALEIKDNPSLSLLFPICCFSVQQWFSTRSDFVFPGHILVVPSVGVWQRGNEGCYWFYRVEARDAPRHPPVHRTAPHKALPSHSPARMGNHALTVHAPPKLELSL